MILSDSNINSLINRVNNELNLLDLWLRKNKLSLLFSINSQTKLVTMNLSYLTQILPEEHE